MHSGGLTVAISAGQSRKPEKRELERAVAEQAAKLPGVRVLQIGHIYDLAPSGETFAMLQGIEQELVVIGWLFDRATHWTLDRNGVQGQVGEVELQQDMGDEEETPAETSSEARVVESQPRPERRVYCLDFRASNNPDDYVAEIKRIADLANAQLGDAAADRLPQVLATESVTAIDEQSGRRWYPVIDYSRCTNCMECIDFCLFGVYGIDSVETLVVEQADACRKGCPACSRVCPENAIMFPQHKTAAIAGAPVDLGGMKIDLSKLFGAPENDENAQDAAARERDEQLILAGREAVGSGSVVASRLPKKGQADELDNLIDQLDSLDL